MNEVSLTSRQKFLGNEDMAELFTFNEQINDSEAGGYTTPKDVVKRLSELGVVQSFGFGRYGVTAFGTWLIETEFEQAPVLPLRTVAEYNGRKL